MSTEISKQDLPQATGLPFTSPRKNKFLELVSLSGNPRTAASELGVSYTTISKHATEDPYFAEMIEVAQGQYMASLEQEATRRARDGVTKDVYFKGEVVGQETVYSDRLLDTLLKANDKDKYGTKPTENHTLVLSDDQGVVNLLGRFLGVDVAQEGSESHREEKIIEGQYQDIGDK